MKHELDNNAPLSMPDGTPYTEEQRYGFFFELARLKATEYQRNRAKEYPSIGDQLDSLYHAGLFPEEMALKIKMIKDKFPKTIS